MKSKDRGKQGGRNCPSLRWASVPLIEQTLKPEAGRCYPSFYDTNFRHFGSSMARLLFIETKCYSYLASDEVSRCTLCLSGAELSLICRMWKCHPSSTTIRQRSMPPQLR
jgi:hypothetical protein